MSLYIPTDQYLSNLYRVEGGLIERNKQTKCFREGDRQQPPYIVVALSFWFHVRSTGKTKAGLLFLLPKKKPQHTLL